MKIDLKKSTKQFYLPPTYPTLIEIPKMKFIQIAGCGDPNIINGEYQQAISILYALSFTIKMSHKKLTTNDDYVILPLEGLWWMTGLKQIDYSNKANFCFISMIRQPEYVTQEIFDLAKKQVSSKKNLDVSKAKLVDYTEGLCVQCLHIGKFDDEPQTVLKMTDFTNKNNLLEDFSENRLHHEIYLSDPRKVDQSKMKTILRHPVKTKNYQDD